MSRGAAIAAAAVALVGVRFRLHGRDPATGLDCVGVAMAAAGYEARAPTGYALRGGDGAGFAAMLDAAGLRRVAAAGPGDVMLIAAGPAQYHLAVKTGRGFVHADAGLRRVVETPGAPSWPVLGVWRVGSDNEG